MNGCSRAWSGHAQRRPSVGSMLSFARDFGTGGEKPPLYPRDREESRRRLAWVLPHSLERFEVVSEEESRRRLAWGLPNSLGRLEVFSAVGARLGGGWF